MKHISLYILLLYSISCFAQDPNPDLFQDWSLYFFQATDFETEYTISEFDPPITPSLTISSNLDFVGIGACNSFEGTFGLPASDQLIPVSFSSSIDDCMIQIQNEFDSEFLPYMEDGGFYNIESVPEGLILIISTPIFGVARFRNFELGTTDFRLKNISVYPNPTRSKLFIAHQDILITKMELFGSLGQRVKIIDKGFDTIDLSELQIGIYQLKIVTELGAVHKRLEL